MKWSLKKTQKVFLQLHSYVIYQFVENKMLRIIGKDILKLAISLKSSGSKSDLAFSFYLK